MGQQIPGGGRKAGSPDALLGISASALMCLEEMAAIVLLGGHATSSMIAEKTGLNRKAVHNSMIHMREAGLVTAHERRGGGYSLNVTSDELTALDVISAVDRSKRGSLFSDDRCAATKACLRDMLGGIPIERIAQTMAQDNTQRADQ